jgi:restriction system protein
MTATLYLLEDGKDHSRQEMIKALGDYFQLTSEQRNKRLPSGKAKVLGNRYSWARIHLENAGLIDARARGIIKIADDGIKLLKTQPERITIQFLNSLPKYKAWKQTFGKEEKEEKTESALYHTDETTSVNRTPRELMEEAEKNANLELPSLMIKRLKELDEDQFEQLVVNVLLAMGYGNFRPDAGKRTGKSGDGGIDGIISEDKLGLDLIYIQAKKFENTVPVHYIRDFIGALSIKKAKRGIFFTTSNFPPNTFDLVERVEHNIILIDGKRLAELMIENNAGVSTLETYQLKTINEEFFEEL